MKTLRAICLVAGSLVVATAVQAAPPWAGSGDDHSGKRASKKTERSAEPDSRARGDRFYDDHRLVVRRYYEQNPSSLPPGLAKRGGNLPPGLAKRGGNLPPGLSRGERLPKEYETHLLPLPRELEIRLPPPPHEVIRRIVGRDLVMIHKETHKVLDILHDALP
ncbi:MAG: hypothetical protein OEV31_03695 [Gammaproteobacteria bacterium]|nr:hypothetical protein [Gammaproteobacteria bacterium]